MNFSEASPLFYYSVSVLLTVFVFLILVFLSVTKKAKKARLEELNAKFQDKERKFFSRNANFLGHSSIKQKQPKGSGYLLLTNDELYFLMVLPPKEINISVKNIISSKISKSYLGEEFSKNILEVKHKTLDNKEEKLAWILKNERNLLDEINKLIKK